MKRTVNGRPARIREKKAKLPGLVHAVCLALVFLAVLAHAGEEEERDDKVEELERKVQKLSDQLEELKKERRKERKKEQDVEKQVSDLEKKVSSMEEAPAMDLDSWVNKFTLGGYGEMHANFEEGAGDDQFDIHRLVMFLGYDFNDWIKLRTETELEHAFVGGEPDEGGGELLFEQAYTDFLLRDSFNIRVGRVLTPLGIMNKWHEPTTFNGVERPAFAEYVIPTTWPSDGAGIFGNLAPQLTYETYVVGGLDGSEFGPVEGLGEGVIAERPSLNDPAVTGRLDYRPFMQSGSEWAKELRLGLSGYYGGIDNGNEGDDPGVDGDVGIISADFEYSVSDFDFRGAIARESIDGARELGGGVAEGISGWYLETAYHFMPEAWKTGYLSQSDAVAFVRYDSVDTQNEMPSGVAADPRGDRQDVTVGLTWHLAPSYVVKADYQFRQDDSSEDRPDAFNMGVGFEF